MMTLLNQFVELKGDRTVKNACRGPWESLSLDVWSLNCLERFPYYYTWTFDICQSPGSAVCLLHLVREAPFWDRWDATELHCSDQRSGGGYSKIPQVGDDTFLNLIAPFWRSFERSKLLQMLFRKTVNTVQRPTALLVSPRSWIRRDFCSRHAKFLTRIGLSNLPQDIQAITTGKIGGKK